MNDVEISSSLGTRLYHIRAVKEKRVTPGYDESTACIISSNDPDFSVQELPHVMVKSIGTPVGRRGETVCRGY